MLSYQIVIALIGSTSTRNGLKVKAVLDTSEYQTGLALAARAALARRLLELVHQVPDASHRLLVAAVELVLRRRREGEHGIVDASALCVDVAGHVQRVRDVGDERGVALARAPRALRRLAAFPAVDQVVVSAEAASSLATTSSSRRRPSSVFVRGSG